MILEKASKNNASSSSLTMFVVLAFSLFVSGPVNAQVAGGTLSGTNPCPKRNGRCNWR
jgi:hypothetical protein